jgi:hypothetical protein
MSNNLFDKILFFNGHKNVLVGFGWIRTGVLLDPDPKFDLDPKEIFTDPQHWLTQCRGVGFCWISVPDPGSKPGLLDKIESRYRSRFLMTKSLTK